MSDTPNSSDPSDLMVLSAGAAKGLLLAQQTTLKQQCGASIGGQFGAIGAMRELFLADTPCDLMVLSAAMIEGLRAAQHLVDDSVVALGSVGTGVAVAQGATDVAVANGEALRQTLLAASAVYFPDPAKATAGIHCAKVIEALGLTQALHSRCRTYPNGATAMATMAQAADPKAIGITQISEILYTPGVRLVAPLPPEFALNTVYSAAISRQARNPGAARQLMTLLTDPAQTALRRAAGFEPAPATPNAAPAPDRR